MNQDVKHCERCGQFYVKPCQADMRPPTPPTRQERTESDPIFRLVIEGTFVEWLIAICVGIGFLIFIACMQ